MNVPFAPTARLTETKDAEPLSTFARRRRLLVTTVLLAVRAIRRHLMRSFLTILGIVIGVAAVVTMVSLGKGATAAVKTQISALGTNILQIRPGQGFGRGGGGPPPQQFKPEDVEAVRNQIGGITSVAPQTQQSVTVIHNAANWSTTVNGTTDDYLIGQQWKLVSGRVFTSAEESAGKAVCIIGNTIKTNLFPNEDPIGQTMRVGSISCNVIGLLTTKGQAGFGGDQDDTVIMPIKAVQRRLTGSQEIRSIYVSVDPAYDSTDVQASITALLRERRHLAADADADFNIFDSAQLAQTLSGTTQVMTSLLAAVAAVSLIVGGIGIMNIMLVSVTERTREIGIRLAIGAVSREVMLQFLVEAVALSCLGGIIGILFALVATIVLAPVMQVPWIFDHKVNLLSFIVSAVIGVVFGYFPAKRAAALNPIDALRHE